MMLALEVQIAAAVLIMFFVLFEYFVNGNSFSTDLLIMTLILFFIYCCVIISVKLSNIVDAQ